MVVFAPAFGGFDSLKVAPAGWLIGQVGGDCAREAIRQWEVTVHSFSSVARLMSCWMGGATAVGSYGERGSGRLRVVVRDYGG